MINRISDAVLVWKVHPIIVFIRARPVDQVKAAAAPIENLNIATFDCGFQRVKPICITASHIGFYDTGAAFWSWAITDDVMSLPSKKN